MTVNSTTNCLSSLTQNSSRKTDKFFYRRRVYLESKIFTKIVEIGFRKLRKQKVYDNKSKLIATFAI